MLFLLQLQTVLGVKIIYLPAFFPPILDFFLLSEDFVMSQQLQKAAVLAYVLQPLYLWCLGTASSFSTCGTGKCGTGTAGEAGSTYHGPSKIVTS